MTIGFGRVTGNDDDCNGGKDDEDDDDGFCVSNGLLSTDVVIGSGVGVVVLGLEVVLVKIDANDMGCFVSVLEKCDVDDDDIVGAGACVTSFWDK